MRITLAPPGLRCGGWCACKLPRCAVPVAEELMTPSINFIGCDTRGARTSGHLCDLDTGPPDFRRTEFGRVIAAEQFKMEGRHPNEW